MDDDQLERRRKRNREWNARNREVTRKAARRWRAKHPDRQAAASRSWRNRNPNYDRDYKRANGEKTREQRRDSARRTTPEKRRYWNRYNYARRKGAKPDAEALEYAEVLLADPCSYCGGAAGTVDHVEPIRDGGLGGAENLTAACQGCNASKGARPLLIFLLDRR